MYYIVFFLGIILSLVNDKKRISFTIFAIILAVFAFLRYGVGADYFSYQYLYSGLSDSVLYEMQYGLGNQEIGFRLIGSLLKQMGFSYQQYLILIATINLYFISKTCKKYSKNPTLSLLLYFSFYYLVWIFSGLRQGLVLSIGVYYLLECMEKKNIIKFTFIVLVLSLIHTSALILLFLYIVSLLSIGKRELFCLMFFSFAISIIPIGKILLHFNWFPFINKLSPYITASYSLKNIFNFQSLGRLVFLFIAFVYYDSYCRQNKISKKIINIYIVSLLLYFMFKFSELTAARLSIYGKMLDILILPNIYYLYKDKINKLIYICCLGILCTLYFSKELITLEKQTKIINKNSIIMPYTNVFNKEDYMFDSRYFHFTDN